MSLLSFFNINERGSTVRQEVIAGLTTFLAMVYSVIVVPGMLANAGFPAGSVFIATCLVAGLGSILIGVCQCTNGNRLCHQLDSIYRI